MSRTPLKLPKPRESAAAPAATPLKDRTSRAWRARPRNARVEPPAPAEAAPAPVPRAPGGPNEPSSMPKARTRRRTRTDDARPPEARAAGAAARAPDKLPRAYPPVKPPHVRPPGVTSSRPPQARSTDRTSARPPKPTARPSPPSPRPPRADPAPGQPELPRLSKRMGELGLCSRREADEWIVNGWVSVDGDVVTTLGTRVSPHARIVVDQAATKHQGELVTILLNKPIGFVSGQAEDGHEPAITLVTRENRWAEDPSPLTFKPSHLRGLAPAGRLDIDSTGLLVFTQDGRIAKHLVGRDSAVEKEYLVRVEGTLDDAGMRTLKHGLELDGVKLKPAQVSWQNEDQLRIVLREGRKRQIRRMCELVGLTVVGLKRVRSGSVPLGKLPVGQWRYLQRNERF